MFRYLFSGLRNTSALGDVSVGKGRAACLLHGGGTYFLVVLIPLPTPPSQVDFYMGPTTPTLYRRSLRWTYIHAALNAVTYVVV